MRTSRPFDGALVFLVTILLTGCSPSAPEQQSPAALATSTSAPRRLVWGEKATVGGLDIVVEAPTLTGRPVMKWEQTPELHEVPDQSVREMKVAVTVTNVWPSVGRLTVESDTVDNAADIDSKLQDLHPGESATQIVLVRLPIDAGDLELSFGSTWQNEGLHRDHVSYKAPVS